MKVWRQALSGVPHAGRNSLNLLKASTQPSLMRVVLLGIVSNQCGWRMLAQPEPQRTQPFLLCGAPA
ncbi:MAG: hypothetical protein M0Q87_03865 [Ottowia sp.]|nr:hypothetical protein [Ottowia sp.]